MADGHRDAVRERHRRARDRTIPEGAIGPWIGGESIITEDTLDTYDPVTGEALAAVGACGEREIDRAVRTAWAGFESSGGDIPPPERSRRLFEWVDVLGDHADELPLLEALDTGKSTGEARG
jgi:aldehyde dehydrogenase (NAD+)